MERDGSVDGKGLNLEEKHFKEHLFSLSDEAITALSDAGVIKVEK
jgi:hypothetical protein